MRDFTVEEILKATEGTLVWGNGSNVVHSVCTDSRLAKPGDIFFPLIGEKNDAHDFLGQVLEAGCRTVIVSDESKVPKEAFLGQSEDTNIIVVENTTAALQKLARYYLNTLPLKYKIAVTGSVGKTSTRDMLYYVASTKYKTGRSMKNFNNGFGLPLSIMEFEPDTEVAVLEMGMSSPGEIIKLSELVRPDIAVITNIGVSHVEHLGSRMGILKEKMDVCAFFTQDSTLIINADNDMLTEENVKGDYRLITVGSAENNVYKVNDVCDFGDKGIKYTLCHDDKGYEVVLGVPGGHNAVNSALAVAAGSLLGISTEEAVSGIQTAELTDKRLNIKTGGRIKVIDDTYNASPESMKSALNTLAASQPEDGGRRVAILGDMFELGSESPSMHLEVGAYAAAKKPDLLIAVGKDARYYVEGAAPLGAERILYYPDKKELLETVDLVVKPGDVVLVKASRGMAMEKVVKEIIKDKE
ncbi:MAG: UDP-N-acetylmuramoyl-tripeptide--D-alanyl-D-alanine ligase [Firmicutes bacterium]|nr:UDP-N-acetylmuramoyl-tripeptide--D-alanyl-D-alanine ligase [Bacillota bacterium]